MKNNNKFIVICTWCKDKNKKDKQAMKKGYNISHGICNTCSDKYWK